MCRHSTEHIKHQMLVRISIQKVAWDQTEDRLAQCFAWEQSVLFSGLKFEGKSFFFDEMFLSEGEKSHEPTYVFV